MDVPVSAAAAADGWSATRRAILMGGALGAGAVGAGLISPPASQALDPPDDRYVWRERGPVNVKDKGAVGTGVAGTAGTDTSAIQSAIASGGVVYFPPGTYLINATLRLPGGRMLYGPGATIKADDTMSPTLELIQNSDWNAGQSDLALVGLEIDCNKTGRGSSPQTTQIEFRGNASGTRSRRITIRECYIHDSAGPALAFQNVEKLRIHDNVITNSDRDGILCQANCREVAIYGNEIAGCKDDHIGFHSGPQSSNQSMDVAITGNVINAVGATNGNGIAVNGILRGSVSGNNIYGGFGAGILVSHHDSFSCQQVTVQGNVIVEPGVGTSTSEGDGIRVGVYPSGGYYGQNGEAPVKDVLFTGNTILRPRRYGVYMEGRSSSSGLSRVTVADNHFTGGYGSGWTGPNYGGGFYAADGNLSEVAIRGNRVCDFQGRGVRIDFAVQRIDITGNAFLNNGRGGTLVEGIYLGPASDVMVVGNRVGDTQSQANKTQSYGLNVGTASGVWCVGNDFSGNKTAGVIGARAAGHGYEANRGDDTKYLDMSAGTGQTIDVKGPVMFVNSPPAGGSATITSITPGYPNQRTTLVFTGSNVTLKDTGTGTLRLNGDLSSAHDTTLTLVTDGVAWFEVGRSANGP